MTKVDKAENLLCCRMLWGETITPLGALASSDALTQMSINVVTHFERDTRTCTKTLPGLDELPEVGFSIMSTEIT